MDTVNDFSEEEGELSPSSVERLSRLVNEAVNLLEQDNE